MVPKDHKKRANALQGAIKVKGSAKKVEMASQTARDQASDNGQAAVETAPVATVDNKNNVEIMKKILKTCRLN